MSDAFEYFTPPENSFGCGAKSFIKWDYFWQLFRDHSEWDLEYRDGSDWISVKGDLTVVKEHPTIEDPDTGVQIEDISKEKITLIFDASHAADYRLTFAIDSRVKEYVEKIDQYQYLLRYKVGEHEGEDEIYEVFFDWSDIVSIPGIIITHGIKTVGEDDFFWFRARKNNIPFGAHIEIDPTFGETGTGSTARTCKQAIYGSKFTMGATGGTATSMSVYVKDDFANGNDELKMAIYDTSYNLVGNTSLETSSGYSTPCWVTVNIISGGSVSASTDYWLAVFADGTTSPNGPSIAMNTFGDDRDSFSAGDPETTPFPDPWDPGEDNSNYEYSIYCTYTEDGGESGSSSPDIRLSTSSLKEESYHTTTKQGSDMYINSGTY